MQHESPSAFLAPFSTNLSVPNPCHAGLIIRFHLRFKVNKSESRNFCTSLCSIIYCLYYNYRIAQGLVLVTILEFAFQASIWLCIASASPIRYYFCESSGIISCIRLNFSDCTLLPYLEGMLNVGVSLCESRICWLHLPDLRLNHVFKGKTLRLLPHIIVRYCTNVDAVVSFRCLNMR
jgi:hypothetical protein